MNWIDNIALRRVAEWVAFILAAAVLCMEFFFDVESSQPLYRTVIILDLTLASGYIAILALHAWRARSWITGWMRANRVQIIFAVFVASFTFMPRVAGSMVIVYVGIYATSRLLDTVLGRKLAAQISLRPSQTLALSFVGLIAFGSTLLMFPAATMDGRGAPFIDALFTITSAACVVGLAVVDTGSYFSSFGQAVILFCVQVGGLGIMVLSASFAVLLGNRLTARKQAGYAEMFEVNSVASLKSLVRAVAAGTFTIEIVGAMMLFWFWRHDIPETGVRVWWSLFHAVSAFCNAGFSLARTNLENWVGNWGVTGVIMMLITLGGLGFFVLADLTNPKVWSVPKKSFAVIWQRLQVQTKVVLVASLLLNIVGMFTFLFLEYDGALRDLSIPTKVNAALFQTVTLRTAGFNTVDFSLIAAPTVLFCVVWMFIGGSPGSTAGGIKTTTAAVAITALRAMLLGRDEVELMGRRIPSVVVNRALSIIFASGVVVVTGLSFLLLTQELPFENLLLEAVSAFGTVGVSMATTPKLDVDGKLIVSLLMFVGRVGPLTMALAIGERQRNVDYKLPTGQIAVG